MNITVYCGSVNGNNPNFKRMAEELGVWMAEQGHTLVYGGGGCGLMGAISNAILDHGGTVVGVIPEFLATLEQMNKRVDNMIHVETMSGRRNLMIEKGDAFVAMPGGTGTLEEIAEIISHVRLGLIDAPCFFLNVDGFYEPLRLQLKQMVEADLYPEEYFRNVFFAENVAQIAEQLCKKC